MRDDDPLEYRTRGMGKEEQECLRDIKDGGATFFYDYLFTKERQESIKAKCKVIGEQYLKD